METLNDSFVKNIKSDKDIITNIKKTNTSTQKCIKCGIIFSGNGEYCSRCKVNDSINSSREFRNNAENILNTISNITLTVGIVLSAILLFFGIEYCNKYSSRDLGIALLSSIIPLLLSSTVTWGVLKVICNISNNLKELNKKIK